MVIADVSMRKEVGRLKWHLDTLNEICLLSSTFSSKLDKICCCKVFDVNFDKNKVLP